MQAYAYDLTMGKSGVLVLKNLPFSVGEEVEVIVIPRPKSKSDRKYYPFRGKALTYIDPVDPVAEADWEVLK